MRAHEPISAAWPGQTRGPFVSTPATLWSFILPVLWFRIVPDLLVCQKANLNAPVANVFRVPELRHAPCPAVPALTHIDGPLAELANRMDIGLYHGGGVTLTVTVAPTMAAHTVVPGHPPGKHSWFV